MSEPFDEVWTFTDDEEDEHSYSCICETCIQNHPERDIFYGDGDYYDWEFDDTEASDSAGGDDE